MPITSRTSGVLRRGALTLSLALVASCRSPQSDAYLIEQIRQMGDELNASRQQASDLQNQLDSLRSVVARQDTLLTRIAGMAGIPR
jgi:hypothetical protein